MPRLEDDGSWPSMAQLLSVAGYSAIGLTVPTGLMNDRLQSLRHSFQDAGLEVFTRADFTCSRRQDLLKLLRRFRRLFDIISVNCINHAIALVAARDRRVDVIFFDPTRRNVWFDHSIANVSHAAFELNLKPLIDDASLLVKTMKEMRIAEEHKLNIVMSSGCTSPAFVRTPSQLSAIGVMLGLGKYHVRDMVSLIPWSILEKNAERRSDEYIEDGVRVIPGKRSQDD
jgi:RNase P/RNase MRP subunit p30